MAQFYTISNSMRAKDRDGNPKVWESQYGTFEVWNVYLQGDDTKYQANKKPGFEGYQKGQQVYGTATKTQYGGQFKQEQVPDGLAAPQQGTPVAAVQNDRDAKLDEILDRVKKLAAAFYAVHGGGEVEEVVLEDVEDGPVNLDAIDY